MKEKEALFADYVQAVKQMEEAMSALDAAKRRYKDAVRPFKTATIDAKEKLRSIERQLDMKKKELKKMSKADIIEVEPIKKKKKEVVVAPVATTEKRGRKKKEVAAETVATPASKPVVITTRVVTSENRPEFNPPTLVYATVVSKKPGAAVTTAAEEPKKPRGRPRVTPLVEKIVDPNAPKKQRGRPRLNPIETTVLVKTPRIPKVKIEKIAKVKVEKIAKVKVEKPAKVVVEKVVKVKVEKPAKVVGDKPKRVLSPEHLEKLRVGRTKFYGEKPEVVEESLDTRVNRNDLTVIEGVGASMAVHLMNCGITKLATIAKMTPEDIAAKLKAAGKLFPFVKTDSWPEQARLAYGGLYDELKTMQASLIAGRKKG